MKVLRIFIVLLLGLAGAAFLFLRSGTERAASPPVEADAALESARETSPLLSIGASRSGSGADHTQLGNPEATGEVSRDAIEQFVTASHRSAASLLAAWSESHDRMWLREAAEKYPDDASVQYYALSAELFPAQRAERLARLRETDPRNGLADFLEASDALAAGNREAAFARLRAAVAKPAFNDYSLELVAAREALMLASFRDPVEAEGRALAGLPVESVPLIFRAAGEVLAEEKAALDRNDHEAAQAAALLSVQIGQALSNPDERPLLIQQRAGMSIEERALIALSGVGGGPAALGFNLEERLAHLQAERDEIKTLAAQFGPGQLDHAKPVLAEYFQHVHAEGELAALRWLAGRKR